MSNHQQPTPPPPPPGGCLPQGQAYGSPPVQERQKKSWFARHKILTGILGVLVLFMVVGALGGGDVELPGAPQNPAASASSAEEGTGSSASSQGSTADESAAEEAPAEPQVGDVVTVGDFAVTVTGTEGGLAGIGDATFGEGAQGQFVKVWVTVENTGDSAEYFFDSDQSLVDDQDRQHSTSSSSWLLDEESLFLAEINPGNTIEGVLLYDIPADAVPTAVDLQAGWLSSSVRVSLEG
ncbi:DUF4352 domain-containing protein [Ornithinimicrobium sp. LYQ121]|uniref:DUF4352 domain-containing protein n=1 Tax=Ornithinimicrobium sp. LYQ121 TaxID=3378801 RepID=UPI003853A4E0